MAGIESSVSAVLFSSNVGRDNMNNTSSSNNYSVPTGAPVRGGVDVLTHAAQVPIQHNTITI